MPPMTPQPLPRGLTGHDQARPDNPREITRTLTGAVPESP